jgi:type I restriction enzyme M protein
MPAGETGTIRNHAAFIWSVADLLRGDYRRSEYGRVILPLTVIRGLGIGHLVAGWGHG